MRRFITALAITIAVLWPICVSAEVQDNDQVAHKIHDLLKASGRMSGSSFVIKCQDGTACLEGRVSSEEQKALALKLTGQVPEINEVVDHLRVESSKKAANPVVRLLSTPFSKPAADEADDEAPQPVVVKKESTLTSWFKKPSVQVAKSPRPQTKAIATNDAVVVARDTDLVYPEAIEEQKPAKSNNILVQQAANLRQVFSRGNTPLAESRVMPVSNQEPRPMTTRSGECAACQGNTARSTPAPRMAQVSNKKYRSTATRANNTVQARPTTAGKVRMVPMIELADGSLVPVDQAQRAALAEPTAGQRVTTASRTRSIPNSRSRQSVARKQEVIEGPFDAAPAPVGPVPSGPVNGGPLPSYVPGTAVGVAPAYYDQPHMPNYSWPSYAAHPNYAGVTYPRQYSPTAWPYIGPFYPYPQVPLGWRKVTLEWDDGWWFLDFDDCNRSYAY